MTRRIVKVAALTVAGCALLVAGIAVEAFQRYGTRR